MSEQLKPCPFCGENVEVYKMTRLLGQDHPGFVRRDCIEGVSVARWNDRPIEDALRARAEKAEAEVVHLTQELEETQQEADAWHKMSDELHVAYANLAGSDEWSLCIKHRALTQRYSHEKEVKE